MRVGTIQSIHERRLQAPAREVGALLDSLSSDDDRLWPRRRWPAMRLQDRLRPGSRGGHGPVRYAVVRYEPAREAAFAFTAAFPIAGEHRYEVVEDGGGTLLRHVLEGRPTGWMRIAWPLCFRWLHDALIEDSLDRAEAAVRDRRWRPQPLSLRVRMLRRLLGVLAVRPPLGG